MSETVVNLPKWKMPKFNQKYKLVQKRVAETCFSQIIYSRAAYLQRQTHMYSSAQRSVVLHSGFWCDSSVRVQNFRLNSFLSEDSHRIIANNT